MRRSLRKFSTIAAVSIIGWLGGAEKAQAQLTEGFSRAICQVFSVVPNLRAEGLAERIGNIRINCIPTIGRENGGAKLDHRAANRSCFWAE